jgi:hypothetical protein
MKVALITRAQLFGCQADYCDAGAPLHLRTNSGSNPQLWKKVKGGFVSKCQNNKGKTMAIHAGAAPRFL